MMIFLLMKIINNFRIKYKPTQINKFLKSLEYKPGLGSFGVRTNIPEYRPRRQYLEFSDCIYDTFTSKQYKKTTKFYDDDKMEVHPCYKFDKSFMAIVDIFHMNILTKLQN